jgi:hypothetical protein
MAAEGLLFPPERDQITGIGQRRKEKFSILNLILGAHGERPPHLDKLPFARIVSLL